MKKFSMKSFLFNVKRSKTNPGEKSAIIKIFHSDNHLSILQNFFTIQDITILIQVCKDFHLIADKRSVWLSFCINFFNYRAENYHIKNLQAYPSPKNLLKNTQFLIKVNRQLQNERFKFEEINKDWRPVIHVMDEIGDYNNFFRAERVMMLSPILLPTVFYDSSPDKPAFHKKIREQLKKYRSIKKIEALESKAIYHEKNSLHALSIK